MQAVAECYPNLVTTPIPTCEYVAFCCQLFRTGARLLISSELKKEESAFKRTLLTTIRSAALARNQYWTAAAWLLERKYPDEFGKTERQRDDAKVDAAPRIVLGVVAQPVQEKLPGFDQTAEGRADG